MDAPTTTDGLSDLLKLLQGGGSVATVVIVWLAVKVKDVAKEYFDEAATTRLLMKDALEEIKDAMKGFDRRLDIVEDDLSNQRRQKT